MAKPRGTTHTTLTNTAKQVVKILKKCAGIKMIAPGEIAPTRSRSQRITISYTTSGLQLLISGEGIQKISLHTESRAHSQAIAAYLKTAKPLLGYTIAERNKYPGI